MRIRDARSSDRSAIEAVTLAAYQQYSALMPAHWEGYRQNILATLAAAQPDAQIVAEEDGRTSQLARRDSIFYSRAAYEPLAHHMGE